MPGETHLTAAMENYLETIWHLSSQNGSARVRDIAHDMGVALSTVTSALRTLAGRGMVNYQPYEVVTLTEHGVKVARKVSRRHELLRKFLIDVLDVHNDTADADACRFEHGTSSETIDRLTEFMEFLDTHPEMLAQWHAARTHAASADMTGAPAAAAPCTQAGHTAPSIPGVTQVATITPTPHATSNNSITDNAQKVAPSPMTRVKGTCTLNTLRPGTTGHIHRVGGSGPIRRRILDMGLIRGSRVMVERIAPLGDPISVKVKGCSVSLRKQEASHIEVTVEQTQAT